MGMTLSPASHSLASFVRSGLAMHDIPTFLVIAVLLSIIGLAVWVCISELNLRRVGTKKPRAE